MPYSKEEIATAIHIAEQAVIRQRRVSRLSELEAPDCIMDASRELQGSSMEKLLDNPLAEKLLPQARIIVAEREARESALDDTVLGRMNKSLSEISAYLAGGMKDPLSDFKAPFTDEGEDNEAWRELLKAIGGRSKKKIVNALRDLLSSAQVELLYRDLPDVASGYEEIPD